MGIRPAGWYRVADHHLQHRYWDGAAWGPLTPPHVTPRATAATSGYLAGRAVGFVVAGRGVDDDELNGPRRAAAAAGARTLLIAPQVGTVITLRGEVPVATHDVDATLGELDDREVDALVLPDGRSNSLALRREPQVARLVRAVWASGRPVGAFGYSVWSLLDARLLSGLAVTSHPSLRREVERAGARWHDRRVVVDGNVITSRDSQDVEAFNTQLIAYLDR